MGKTSTRRRLLTLSAVIACCAICSSGVRSQTQDTVADLQSTFREFGACLKAAMNGPELDPLRSHFPDSFLQPSPEQIADTSLATDEEIRVLVVLHPRSLACYEAFLGQISQSAPLLAANYAAQLTKVQASLIDLLQRKEGWGDHLQRSKNANFEGATERAALRKQLTDRSILLPQVDSSQQQEAFAEAMRRLRETEVLWDSIKPP